MKYRFILLIFLIGFLSGCQKHDKRYLVVSKIKSTAKLATTQTTIDKLVVGNKERKLFGLVKISGSDFVAESEATILTGIDLTKLEKDDVQIKGNLIEVQLPPVEVLDFQYPFDKFKINHALSNQRALSKIDVLDMESFYRQAEIDIRNQIPYMGIREQTEANTRILLTGLLTNLGYKEIYISFKPSKEPMIPTINWKKYLNTDHE